MNIRRFTARSMPEALREVRAALGADAIILETFEAGNGHLTVVAANDVEHPSAGQRLAEEGRQLASLARTMTGGAGGTGGPRAELGSLAAVLAAQGVEGTIAAALVRATAASLTDGEPLGAALARAFTAMASPEPEADVAAHVFIGPPGDGKTTTIAKLAARARQAGRQVLLVGTDTLRVGAGGELAAYGRALGAAVERAATPRALAAILAGAAPGVTVFVDTAGASAGQPRELAATAALLEAVGPRARRTLVASAATGARAAQALCDGYAPLSPAVAVVTKCDAAPPGPLLGLLWRRGVAVSHLARGRRIPDDLEVATADRLARSVLAA